MERLRCLRQTIRKRVQAKLNAVESQLQRACTNHARTGQVVAAVVVDTSVLTRGVCCADQNALCDFSGPSVWALAIARFRGAATRPRPVGIVVRRTHHSLAAYAYQLSSLPPAPHGRHTPRQRARMRVPLVGSVERGGVQNDSYLRLSCISKRWRPSLSSQPVQ